MKKVNVIIVLVMALGALAACNHGKHRNQDHIYVPDMYYSRAYDAYTENPNFADNQSSRMPVPGTIKRGELLPYHVPDNDSGYAYAGDIKSPLTASDSILGEGKRLFDIYCGICHGEKLDGNGPLYNGGGGPFAAAPANFISGPKSTLPAGTIFWVATYGIRNMGSYASQLNRYQRWMIVDYIKSVQHKDGVTQAQEDSTQRALVAAYRETLSAAK